MDDDWVHVGDVDPRELRGGWEQRLRVRELLAANGFGGARGEDVRIDVLCFRNETLDSLVRVYVRKIPSQPKPKKKPRRQ